MTGSAKRRTVHISYQLFMLVLCAYAIAALAVQTFVSIKPGTQTILVYADHAVCAVFLADFIFNLTRAPDRWRYFFTWGWLDLLSSIPVIEVLRWGRAGRILRVFRVLRGIRMARLAVNLFRYRRAENVFLAVSLTVFLLVVLCSIALLHFEIDADSNINTAGDAIWCAFVTTTTVGYGDRVPVTPEGRIVAAILMCTGVGLFGTLSGLFATWLIGGDPRNATVASAADLHQLREEIAELRRLLESRAQLDGKDET